MLNMTLKNNNHMKTVNINNDTENAEKRIAENDNNDDNDDDDGNDCQIFNLWQ